MSIILIIFSTGVIGISVAGMMYSKSVQAGSKKVICSGMTFLDELIYGSEGRT